MPLYCRKWDCESCGKHHRRRLRRRLLAGEPNSFLTLTVNPALFESSEDAFRQASLAINRLFKVLRRRYPHAGIQYALVWERTKRGWPHAHILLKAPYLPQALLSREWRRLSGASIVDIRQIRTEGEAAAYVTKYLTKDPAVPFGFRRFRFSLAYAPAAARQRLSDLLGINTWTRCAAPVTEALQSLNDHGYDLYEYLPELWVSVPP